MSIQRSQFLRIENKLLWIFISLIVKGAFFLFFLSDSPKVSAIDKSDQPFLSSSFGRFSADTESYINPADNLAETGKYMPDYRMPGYAFPYVVYRLFLGKTTSLNLLLITQLILSSISIYLLALLAFELTKSKFIFFTTYGLYLICTYVSIFDVYILTESFTISASIIGAYFLFRGLRKMNSWSLIISSIFLTWAYFMRPVYAPYIPLAIISILILSKKKNTWKKALLMVAYFCIPLFLIEGSWLIFNWKKHEKIVPLTTSVLYPGTKQTALYQLILFSKAQGWDSVWWNPDSEMSFFIFSLNNNSLKFKNCDDLEDIVYTSAYNCDSLNLLKSQFKILEDKNTSRSEKAKVTKKASSSLKRYTASIKDEKPLNYYIISRLNLFKKFFFHSGTYNLFSKSFSELSIVGKSVKLFMSFLYYIIILGGFAGIIKSAFGALKSKKINNTFLFLGFPVYSILVFPFVLGFIEYRYFAPAFPFMIICSAIFFQFIIRKFNSTKG